MADENAGDETAAVTLAAFLRDYIDSPRPAKEIPHGSFRTGKRELLRSSGHSRKRPNSGGGTRTPDTRIMIPPSTPLNAEENGDSQDCAAHGAAVEHDQGPSDPDLAAVIDAWDELPMAVRVGIVAMVRAADGRRGQADRGEGEISAV